MGVPSWFDDAAAWDRLEVNGFSFEETKVDVDGDFGNDFDVKKAPGADGATLTNKGVEPIKPSIKWQLWNQDHWDTYEAMMKKIYPHPGKTPLPLLEVIHPQLQLLSKSKFRLVRVHTLKMVGPQIMEARLDLLEYFDKAKTIPKPDTRPSSEQRPQRNAYDSEWFQGQKPSNSATKP